MRQATVVRTRHVYGPHATPGLLDSGVNRKTFRCVRTSPGVVVHVAARALERALCRTPDVNLQSHSSGRALVAPGSSSIRCYVPKARGPRHGSQGRPATPRIKKPPPSYDGKGQPRSFRTNVHRISTVSRQVKHTGGAADSATDVMELTPVEMVGPGSGKYLIPDIRED